MQNALIVYQGFWEASLERPSLASEAFDAALREYSAIRSWPGIFCREEFVSGEEWADLRRMARAVLAEQRIEPPRIPDVIRFGNLVELVGLDD